jgi:hypothetical protein
MSNFRPPRNRVEDDDDPNFEVVNGKRVLRDGGRMSVRMLTMDSGEEVLRNTTEHMQAKQRMSARDAAEKRFADHLGLKDAAALHRPGYRGLNVSDEAKDARRQAYEDYSRELSMAYLLPQQGEHTGAGSRGPRETRKEGDRCLVQGQWGTLVDDGGGELICVPDDAGDTRDAATIQRDHAQTMRDEYARYEAELSEAWRGQK